MVKYTITYKYRERGGRYKSIAAVTLAISMIMGSVTVSNFPVQAASVLQKKVRRADTVPETSKDAFTKYSKIEGI